MLEVMLSMLVVLLNMLVELLNMLEVLWSMLVVLWSSTEEQSMTRTSVVLSSSMEAQSKTHTSVVQWTTDIPELSMKDTLVQLIRLDTSVARSRIHLDMGKTDNRYHTRMEYRMDRYILCTCSRN